MGEMQSLISACDTNLLKTATLAPRGRFEVNARIHCESKKGCHPNHSYYFVNSWSICKIFHCCKEH